MDSNPICHPSPAKRMKCSFLDYVRLLMIAWAGQWTLLRPPPLSSQKNKMFIFGLCSTSDDWPGWSMDSKPICHPSPANKIKCSFFGLCSTSDDWPGWSMDSKPLLPPLSRQKNEMLIVGLGSTWWSARLVNGLEPHTPPLCRKKIKCSFLDYIQLLMITWAG